MSRRRMGSYDGCNFVPIEHYNKLTVSRTKRSTSPGAKRAGRSQLAYKQCWIGFYVANAFTGIVIDGPFATRDEALQAAREHEPPAMKLEVIDE